MEPHMFRDTDDAAPQVMAPNPMLANPGSIPRMTISPVHPSRFPLPQG
jgi:hypothetical protein